MALSGWLDRFRRRKQTAEEQVPAEAIDTPPPATEDAPPPVVESAPEPAPYQPPPPPPVFRPPPPPQAPVVTAPSAVEAIQAPVLAGLEAVSVAEADGEAPKVGLLARFKAGLSRTREAMSTKVRGVIARYRSIDEALFEELLDSLLEADVGFETAEKLVNRTKQLVKENGIREPAEVEAALQEAVREIVTRHPPPPVTGKRILLVLGVNGVGKTTTIAKLAHYYKNQGERVLVAAADTFRAGAIHQLETWADRVGVDFHGSQEGQDPSAVVYQALARFHKEGQDLLIVDTAGRLHTRSPLMEELKKMCRVALKQSQETPIRTLLVLDAHTGQNALNQALAFKEACEVQELVLTKLDGTPKGGAVVAIAERLQLPVSWVGLGEKMTDLRPFDGEAFARALFEGEDEE